MPTTRPLTPKQERFVIEYSKDLNATKAARRAGYKGKCLNRTASQLLGKTRAIIEARKQAVMAKREETGIATLEETLRLCTKMAFHDRRVLWDTHGNPVELCEVSEDHALAVAGFEVEELYEGRGADREKVGYLKKFHIEPRASYVNMLLKFHGAFPTKQVTPPPDAHTSRNLAGWDSMSLPERLALRAEVAAVIQKHMQGRPAITHGSHGSNGSNGGANGHGTAAT